MNRILQDFARDWLNTNLALCTENQQLIFKRMYSHADLEKSVSNIVSDMDSDKLSWAMEQVDRTLEKNNA